VVPSAGRKKPLPSLTWTCVLTNRLHRGQRFIARDVVTYVVGIREVDEPVPFWRVTDPWLVLGEEVRLHAAYPLVGGAQAVCLWEGEPVEGVADFVERRVGEFSSVELYEVALDDAFRLPV
jgi:hypothetical protein